MYMSLNDFTSTPSLDMAIIAESKALLQEKFTTIATYFLEDSAMYIGRIEQAFAAGDAEALVPPAHTLKSSSRQMGALRLSAVAEHIEITAREAVKSKSDLPSLEPAIAQLRDILESIADSYR